MPPKVEENLREKQGFLALGLNPGEPIPLFDKLGIPSRVGQEGEALWQIRSLDLFLLDAAEPYRGYGQGKLGWILNSIFRGWNLFLRALNGDPIRLRYNWDVPLLPTPDYLNQIPTLFERAPLQAQTMALTSAFEYLKP
ncbi:MAG: hypothetical protein HY609_02425 [Deltaproteobacteria bacterium]|nr:hypothetical protein [Deltaproteobacteria bacterium]MBI4223764.1 hypothetical protein [Deltaproteobacteria bacterium]